jgi:hypothetical protein
MELGVEYTFAFKDGTSTRVTARGTNLHNKELFDFDVNGNAVTAPDVAQALGNKRWRTISQG